MVSVVGVVAAAAVAFNSISINGNENLFKTTIHTLQSFLALHIEIEKENPEIKQRIHINTFIIL